MNFLDNNAHNHIISIIVTVISRLEKKDLHIFETINNYVTFLKYLKMTIFFISDILMISFFY